MTRVGICDDNPEARAFLEMVISQEPSLTLEAGCSSGEEAVAEPGAVEVWLMDLRMPGMGGRRTCEELLANDPKVKVLFLTAFPEESVAESLKAGASGYLFKDEAPDNIISAVKAVKAGLVIGSRTAVGSLVGSEDTPNLSEFTYDSLDKELVAMIMTGHSNHEMAEALHLSESGVKKRLNKLMLRAGVVSRPMLMAKLYGLSPTR